MMEIVYGPLILGSAARGLLFGLVFSIVYPWLEARLMGRKPAPGVASRLGRGMVAGSLLGLAHLIAASTGDGFPPRIIQSAGLAYVLLATLGVVIVQNAQRTSARQLVTAAD